MPALTGNVHALKRTSIKCFVLQQLCTAQKTKYVNAVGVSAAVLT